MKKGLQLTQSQIKIVNKLSQAKNVQLRWSQLVEQVNLSRRTLSLNLKELEKKKLVARVVDVRSRNYPPPVYYQLKPSKIDLVDWFLSQLESMGVPKEVVGKGRTVLNVDILSQAVVIYAKILKDIWEMFERSQKDLKVNEIAPPSVVALSARISKTKIPDFKIEVFSRRGVESREDRELSNILINELNPYTFNTILIVLFYEEGIFEGSPDFVRELEKVSDKFAFPRLSDDLKAGFTKTREWWVKDVVNYLPAIGFFTDLTTFYLRYFLNFYGLRQLVAASLSSHPRVKRTLSKIEKAYEHSESTTSEG